MSAISATDAGRRAAEALMLDTGRATRPTGGTRYDAATKTDVADTEPLFDTPCKVQANRGLSPTESEVGARTATTVRLELHLPASTEPLSTNDVVEIIAVHPMSLARDGQRFRVVAPVTGTLKTAARYEVEEVVS